MAGLGGAPAAKSSATFHAGTLLFCSIHLEKPLGFFTVVLMVFLLPPMRRHKSQSRACRGHTGEFLVLFVRHADRFFFWSPWASRHRLCIDETLRRRFLACVQCAFSPWCVSVFRNNFTFYKSVKRTVISFSSSPLSLLFACKHVPICFFLSRSMPPSTMKKFLVGKQSRVCMRFSSDTCCDFSEFACWLRDLAAFLLGKGIMRDLHIARREERERSIRTLVGTVCWRCCYVAY